MYSLMKSANKGNSRQQIDIRSIKDGVLKLNDCQYRAILSVSSLNFELKSEEEQDALIDTYESFLNAIGFPLQILVRIREIDMDSYLEELSYKLKQEKQTIYKQQLENYNEFVRSLISNNKILSRTFYVVIPFDASPKADYEMAKEQLNLRKDIVIKGLSRLGMNAYPLLSLNILDLFYSFYSPTQAKLQPLSEQALSLIHKDYIISRNF